MRESKPWWSVEEQPFQSDKAVVGRLIVWFRQVWNSVATQWYVRPMIQQQNEINHRIVVEITQLREELSVNQDILGQLDRELQDLNRIQTETLMTLRHEVQHLRQRIQDLEQPRQKAS
jgi:hypothetical protein